jgi:cytoskeletal protein CcmA (bactofilin family)
LIVRRLAVAALLALTMLGGGFAHAQSGGLTSGAVTVPDREGDAAYAAPAVSVPGRIGGDLMILTGRADVTGEVGDNTLVVANRYAQTGEVGGELAVMAKSADIEGGVGGDLYLSADDVRLRQTARVGQDARIFGKDVLIKGRIDRNLDVSADTVALGGTIAGDVTVHAREIYLAPNTVINGAFRWRSPNEPDVPDEAVIRGGAEGTIDKAWQPEGVLSWASPLRGAPNAALFAGEAAVRLMVALSAFAIGMMLVLFTPHYADRVFVTVRERWAVSLAWGALVLFATPVIAILMMMTIVGIPLGFLLLLSLPFLCLWGYAVGAAGVGAIAFKQPRIGQRILALAVGLLVVTIVSLAPFVGGLFGTIATLLGLGALMVALRPRPILAA